MHERERQALQKERRINENKQSEGKRREPGDEVMWRRMRRKGKRGEISDILAQEGERSKNCLLVSKTKDMKNEINWEGGCSITRRRGRERSVTYIS